MKTTEPKYQWYISIY